MRKTDDPLFYPLINLEEDLEFHRRMEKGDILEPTGFEPIPDRKTGRHWPNDASGSKRQWTKAKLGKLNAQIILLAVTTHIGRPLSIAVKLGIDASYVRKVLNEHSS